MKIEVTIELYGVKNVDAIINALEPDNITYKEYSSDEISCTRSKEVLICKIKSADILKARGLLNDLLVNLQVILKSFQTLKD